MCMKADLTVAGEVGSVLPYLVLVEVALKGGYGERGEIGEEIKKSNVRFNIKFSLHVIYNNIKYNILICLVT